MTYFLISIVGFLAFFMKGIMGTGSTTVLVAFGSLIIGPKNAVVLASFINIFGGLAMLNTDPVTLPRRYWISIAIAMIIGSVIGALSLKIINPNIFEIIMGIVFLLVSLLFIFKNQNKPQSTGQLPEKESFSDLLVAGFSGFCGGFIGVCAPPLVHHFGSYLNKQFLRRLLVIIFIPAALAQTITFILNGLFTFETLVYGFLIIPGLLIGIQIGNKVHHVISELWFRRILGIFLLIVSIKLIF